MEVRQGDDKRKKKEKKKEKEKRVCKRQREERCTNNDGEETYMGKQDGKYSNNAVTQREPTASSLVKRVKSTNVRQHASPDRTGQSKPKPVTSDYV